MTSAPAGWAQAPLADVLFSSAVFTDGDWVETKDQDPTGDVRLTQLADIGVGKWRNRSARFMNLTRAKEMGCTFLEPGDVLVARMPDPLGRACIFPGDPKQCVTAVDVCVIRPDPRVVSPRWLMWALNAPETQAQVVTLQSGTTRKRISRRNLGTVKVLMPPRAEQERIVAAIEEQFSRLDEAERLLVSARRRAERLRVAAMATATSGDWPVKALADVTAKQEYGSSVKASATQANGVPIVRMGNIQDGRVDLSRDVKYLPPDHPDAARYALRDGDLLFNRTNSPELVGKSAAFRGSPARACFASYLIRVQLDDRCLPEWASLYLNSPSGRRWAASVRSQQVGQANINGSKLAAMPLPLPPVEEQHRILGEFQRQVSLVESATAVVDRALIRAGHLRRAILARAFSGQLVSQDPSDEPASELLARLRAETSVKPNGSRRRKQP